VGSSGRSYRSHINKHGIVSEKGFLSFFSLGKKKSIVGELPL